MSNGSNSDDKATKVLDIGQLKKELEERQKLELDTSEFASKVNPVKKMAILFNFNTNYFDSVQDQFKKHFDIKINNDLDSLTKSIKNFPQSFVFFYYNAGPKAINQLVLQIKEKFNDTQTVICAEGLSPQKMNEHKNTKYQAHHYVNLSELENELKKFD